MDAVILCGGLGTRIRSVSGEKQKTMLAVDGRPFMDLMMTRLAVQNIRRFILCVGYQADSVRQYYERQLSDWDLQFSVENEPLGTGGALKNAQAFIQSNPFLVINGDSFVSFNREDMLKFHQRSSALCTMGVSVCLQPVKGGGITLSDDGRVLRFAEKSDEAFKFYSAGLYCFNQSIWKELPDEKIFSLEVDVFPRLINKGLYGFDLANEFLDIGTPENYFNVKKVFEQ